MKYDPIAYIYEADWHCPECAIFRFGAEPGYPWVIDGARDDEGNFVGVVAPWDEWWQGYGENESLGCADCGRVIDTYEP
jgi:hypothetical protein